MNNTLVDSVHQTFKFLSFMCLDTIVREEEESNGIIASDKSKKAVDLASKPENSTDDDQGDQTVPLNKVDSNSER